MNETAVAAVNSTGNNELVSSYIRGSRMMFLDNKTDDISPILPFLMMDAQYQLFRRTVVPLRVSGRTKQIKKRWSECYTAFNKAFFACYTPEQQDAVIDKMDDFEDYIANDLMVLKVALMNCFPDENLTKQGIIADCMTCNILAQSAQIVWGRVYKKISRQSLVPIFSRQINGESNHISRALRHGCILKESVNPYIDGVRNYSKTFLNLYYPDGKTIDLNDDIPLTKAVNIICRKMIQWMKVDTTQSGFIISE